MDDSSEETPAMPPPKSEGAGAAGQTEVLPDSTKADAQAVAVPRDSNDQDVGDQGDQGAGGLAVEPPPRGNIVEKWLLCLLCLGIVFLPVLASLRSLADVLRESRRIPWLSHAVGFVLHKILPSDLTWASLYVQNATVWIGFLGALLAVAGGKHLGLSTTSFLAKGRLRTVLEGFTTTVFVLVALFLTYASAQLVSVERLTGANDLLPGGLRKWYVQLVIPVVFALMAPRAAWRVLKPGLGDGHEKPPSVETFQTVSTWRRFLPWAVCGVTFAAAVALFLFGFFQYRYPTWQALAERTHKLSGLVKWLGLFSTGTGFLLGLPVFAVMAGLAMTLFFMAGTPIASLPNETLRLVANPQLPAIPLLTIAGYVLATGRSSHRLVRAYKSVLGFMPGGMSVMVVVVCAVFTTFTGASGVTILALGGLVYPMLLRDRYPQGFSLGLVTAAGSLGLLFPPSLPVILYSVAASTPGSVAPVTVEQLFIAGFIPGVFLILLVSGYGVFRGISAGAPKQAFKWNEAGRALWEAKWDLFLPVVIMGSFLSGIATIVESAALGAAYALAIELIVFRNVHPFRDLPGALLQAASLVGAVVVLLGVAMGLTNYLVEAEVPTRLVEWVQAHIHSRWVFLLILNLGLLVLGSVLEIYSAIVVLVPLVAPLGVAFEVNPVHLGVIFLANLELGFLCPPMGLNLFLSATRFQKPLPHLYRHALPFLLIMTFGVLFITYIPSASLWLLRMLGKA
ncbi:MAG TPA: TRAP transporter large permease subunit [Pseudomonadota bacterium]|nr:TRAP transporter large permease subunit [Pseudomonadota bacterium]